MMPSRFRGFAFLLDLAFSADRRQATLAFSPIFPLMAGVSFGAMRVLISAVIDGHRSETVLAGVVFGVALCISVTLGRVGNTARLHVGEAMSRELERRLIGIVLASPELTAFEDPAYQDDLEVLRGEREAIVQSPRMLGWIVDGVGGLLVSLALLLSVKPILGLLLLAGVPTFVLNGWAENRINTIVRAEAQASRQAGHFFDLATTAGPAKELRTAGLQGEIQNRYHQLWTAADQRLFRAELRMVLMRMIGACIVRHCARRARPRRERPVRRGG